MSVAVGLDELRQTIAEFTTDPYLLSVGDDGRAHTVAVAVRWSGDELVVPAGNTTATNATARRRSRCCGLRPHGAASA